MGNPAGDAEKPGPEERILFLDDSDWRHEEFMRRMEGDETQRVWQARSAGEAIAFLDSVRFDRVFLDHDLSEDDILMTVGGKSKVSTGMDVVDHVLRMDDPPREAVVHSCNTPAAEVMQARLAQHPAGIRVSRVPFPFLMKLMGAR